MLISKLPLSINSNSVPQTAWAVMEVIKDRSLFQAVREEVDSVSVTDPKTGKPTFDVAKLVTLPLLQSIYVETLRMHVSINITREVMEPTELGGYHLSKGSLVQAPTQIGHREESVWGVEGHPASEFWAERHIKYVEKQDEDGKPQNVKEFSMTGRPSDFFPYGKLDPSSRLHDLGLHVRHRWWCVYVPGAFLCQAGDYAGCRYDCVSVRH